MPSDLAVLRERLVALVGGGNVTADGGAYAVDGMVPALVVRPGTQHEVSGVVAACAEARAALVPWGGGTAMAMGNPPRKLDVVVSLERLDRVVEFDPDNLCITVEAGMPLGRLQALVAERQERLPLDPPDADRVTLGGLVAANQSGPCRLLHGTARDWVLGLRVVLPDGTRIHCGGRVIKNVSGYDMNKLFIQSFGTLGIITEVTVKLLPMPVCRATVLGSFAGFAEAAAVLAEVQASFLLPEALELLDPAAADLLQPVLGLETCGTFALVAGFSGSQSTVDRQVRDLEAMAASRGGHTKTFREAQSDQAWTVITNVQGGAAPDPRRVVCQLAVPIARTAGMLVSARTRAAAQGLTATVTAHVGSGLVRAALLPGADQTEAVALAGLAAVTEALREEAVGVGGSLVLLEAPPRFKARVEAWGKPGSSFATMRRIKTEFDPQDLCSPGRFLGGM
jgi:glycolate oxidase FAD binding subunit